MEHVIGYAYATSPYAKKMGFNATGCYFYEVPGKRILKGFATKAGTL